jgi:hypothetical protein
VWTLLDAAQPLQGILNSYHRLQSNYELKHVGVSLAGIGHRDRKAPQPTVTFRACLYACEMRQKVDGNFSPTLFSSLYALNFQFTRAMFGCTLVIRFFRFPFAEPSEHILRAAEPLSLPPNTLHHGFKHSIAIRGDY